MRVNGTEASRAHSLIARNRDDVLKAGKVGCCYCLNVYPASEIGHFIDERDGVGRTAICPRCGVDAVIADVAAFRIGVTTGRLAELLARVKSERF